MKTNQVILIGNLGNDPEIKNLEGGSVLAKIRIATNEKYTNKEGIQVENVQWHNVIAWGETAKEVGIKLKKGSYISLEGRLAHRSYEDKNGTKRYVTEVVMNSFQLISNHEKQTV